VATLPSGSGYLSLPAVTPAPGVLALHAWWGLTPGVKEICDRLADHGFVVLAPDLNGGRVTDDNGEARQWLIQADMNVAASLVQSSLVALRQLPATLDAPGGLVGLGMGASWALWLAARFPSSVRATAVFYGSQDIDMSAAECAFLGHFAERDDLVSDDDKTLLEADLRLLGKEVEFHHYPGTRHGFAEADRDVFHPAAAERAWLRTLAFLRERLDRRPADRSSR
jgi:carboxymethylenebutenolidase